MTDTGRIYRTLLYYCQHDGEKDVSTNIVDMLADLMHLADEYSDGGADGALTDAARHYEAERDLPTCDYCGFEIGPLSDTSCDCQKVEK